MNKIFSTILFTSTLALMCSCSTPQVREEDKDKRETDIDPEGMKLMSFNVRYQNTSDTGERAWSNRLMGVSTMMKEERPMVMGVQECLKSQLDGILGMRPEYASIGVGREDGKEKGEMMAILYLKDAVSIVDWGTYWLSETPDTPSKGWDAACYRTATWARVRVKSSGKEFLYTDTHLDHKGSVARSESMKLIESRMKALAGNDIPMVLTADFNSMQSDAIFNGIYRFMSNVRATAPITDNKPTYNAFGDKNGSIIDHIFISDKFKPLKYRTVDSKWNGVDYISDHCPIYTILQFE